MFLLKKIPVFLSFITIVIMQSCDYGILYQTPQPGNTKNLKKFPSSLIGKYRNDSSKVTVLITKNRVIKINEYDIAASRVEIDTMTDCKLIGDSLYISDINASVHVDLTTDSVFGILKQPDTLFIISKDNILRNLNDEYFLNLKHDSDYWQVVRLCYKKNEFIEFSVVTHKTGYDVINDLTPVRTIKNENDSILNYHINPKINELKSIIEAGLFDTREIYYALPANK